MNLDYKENIPEYYEAMELAVKSLQEIQHYRGLEQNPGNEKTY